MLSSRLAATHQKRLMKQTFMFTSGGILVIIAFAVIGIPLFSKILAVTNKPISTATATPPPIITSPILTSPFTATNSATITLTGKAQTGLTVLLGQNGSIEKKTNPKDDGSYEFQDVSLQSGENMFQAYAEDSQGNRSDGSSQITVTYQTDAPKLDISEPANNSTITQRKQSVVSVKGKTEGGNKIYINDQFIFVSTDGSFSGSVQLQDGDNTIKVRAVNTAGNETASEILVHYLP